MRHAGPLAGHFFRRLPTQPRWMFVATANPFNSLLPVDSPSCIAKRGDNSFAPQRQRQRQTPPSSYLSIPLCLELTQTTRRTDVPLKPTLDVQVFQHCHPHCPGPHLLLPFVHLASHRRKGNSHPYPSPAFSNHNIRSQGHTQRDTVPREDMVQTRALRRDRAGTNMD